MALVLEAQIDVLNVELLRVYDGDTFFVSFPDNEFIHKLFADEEIAIRIRDISAYEITKREKDAKKREEGRKAGYALTKLLNSGYITLHNVEIGTFKRLVADVKVNGKDVGEYMIKEGYAQKYKKK